MPRFESHPSNESTLILGIGELLWDLLPEGPRLGGAPANYCLMAARLGNHSAILSRIGRDLPGRQAFDLLDPLPVDASNVEIDGLHETGRVTVAFENNEPHYTIHEPAAWDYMDLTDAWLQLAERADAICFGSLAQRHRISRQTIQTLVAQTRASSQRIFDVNLRSPFYSSEVVEESLELATVLKLNDAEMPLLLNLLGLESIEETSSATLRSAAARLLNEFPDLELVAVTCGSRGSLLVRRTEWNEHPGYPVLVADTVGAGDAFTAALTHYLLRGAPLKVINDAGNRWGSWIASQSGAMPPLPEAVLQQIASDIEA
jgi:fructokinase